MGVINNKKKFIWTWVPKCAGSFFYSHPDFKEADHSIEGGHETYTELCELIDGDLSDYFTFAFSRNPYSRIVSAFHHFKRGHDFNYYSCFDDFILDNFKGNDGSLSVDHSKTYASSYRRQSNNGLVHDDHFRPQSYFMENKSGVIDSDFIGKTENLPDDFNFVCNKLDIKIIENKILNHHTINENKHDPYMSYFEGPNSREKLDIVNFIYQKDFTNHGYEQA